MAFSKLWLVLLAAAGCLGFGLALVAPRPVVREISSSYAKNLDRAQHAAELMLRLEARDWIDTASKISRDRTLVEVLLQANNSSAPLDQLKAKAQGRMLTLVSMLKVETRPELVILVDVRGKQVFRMGPGEGQYKPGEQGLGGYPLVEEALRGFRRDDTWNVDGKLYLMAASPVIAKSRGRYVGALVLGEEINDAFARRFKAHLDRTDVAFYLRGKTMGATLKSAALERLPLRYTEAARQKEIAGQGRSATLMVGKGAESHYVIMTPLPGEARYHDAFYTVVGPPATPIGLGEAIGLSDASDISWANFPWLLLLGGFLVAVVVGVALLVWEVDGPQRRLAAELNLLGKGELPKLNPANHKGRLHAMALSINRALERPPRRGSPTTEEPYDSSEVEQYEPSPRDTSRIALDGSGGAQTMPPLADGGGAAPAPGGGLVPTPTRDELGPGVRPLKGLEAEEAPTQIQSPQHQLDERGPYDTAVDPPLASPTPTFDPMRSAAGAPAEPEKLPFSMPATQPELGATDETLRSSVPESMARAAERDEGEDLDRYMNQVFKEFVTVKRQCGEDTANLTFERFRKKLMKNRSLLIERYSCRSVKFQVYIKDGKAALKATPVKG